MSIVEKLHKIQSSVSVIDKTGHNKFSGYDYVQLGGILERLNPLLNKLGLVLVQSVVESDCDYRPVSEKAYYSVARCVVETTLREVESGETITNLSSGFSMDKNGDKAAFKSITGARKYGLTMMFKVHWDSVEPEEDTPNFNIKKRSASPKHYAATDDDFF